MAAPDPLDGTPADVAERFDAYAAWLASTPEVPKTLLTASPHGLGSPALIDWAREHIAGLEIADLGEEVGHHAPEDAPEAIAEAVLKLLDRLG
ncbi:hypothetical protein GCM10029992_17990 [Glycomyces albus]